MICIQKINSRIFFILLLTATAFYSEAQTDSTPKKVAIFLYKGAEILDLAGPSEVFSSSGYDTYTMSVDGNEILSQGFITIKPQYSLDNAPVPDIVVFPGGGATAPANDPRVMAWVKKLHDRGSILMSVCTGAQILARAGYLDHKNVTTWHGYIKDLQKLVPTAVVLGNTRYVDNGNIITTAGVSAGIDGSLYLVSRLNGMEAAKQTAYYMEYDKWDPKAGRVDVKIEGVYVKPTF